MGVAIVGFGLLVCCIVNLSCECNIQLGLDCGCVFP